MRLLGTGTLPGLRARGLAKLEVDTYTRNQRIKADRQRAEMRALIAVPPRSFPPGQFARTVFHVEVIRVAPASQQLPEQQLDASLKPVAQGIADHLRRCSFAYLQVLGPWAVEFRVYDAEPTAVLNAVEPVAP